MEADAFKEALLRLQAGDRQAEAELVQRNLPLVAAIAAGIGTAALAWRI